MPFAKFDFQGTLEPKALSCLKLCFKYEALPPRYNPYHN